MKDLNFIEDNPQGVVVTEPEKAVEPVKPVQPIQKEVPPAPAKVQELPPVKPPVPQPEVKKPPLPKSISLPAYFPEHTNQALNDLFSEALDRMGIEEGVKKMDFSGKVPDDILEKMLQTKLVGPQYGDQTVEDFLRKSFTYLSEVEKENKYIVPSHEDIKEALEHVIIDKMLKTQRIRGWDVQKKIISFALNQADIIRDKYIHIQTVGGKIRQLEREGIPLNVQEMFPMPPEGAWAGMKQLNVMQPRIRAERLTEAFRQKDWEYGKEPVNEKGEPVRAGEKGSRTYAAFEEFNRAYDILSRTKTDYWKPPTKMVRQMEPVRPFGGSRDVDRFEYMKRLLNMAIDQNEKTGGKLAESVNAIIKPNNPINLNRGVWSKGHEFYVSYPMIDPIRTHEEPYDFYDSLMSGKAGGPSMDIRGEEGGLVREYSKKYEGYKESEEDVKEQRDIIKKVHDPLTLISTPLMSLTESSELPMKRKFTVPNASQKVYEHMFPEIPKTKEEVQKKIEQLESHPIFEQDPDTLTPEQRKEESDITEKIGFLNNIMKLPENVDVGKYYEYAMAIKSGISQASIENIISKMYERRKGEVDPIFSPLSGAQNIENFIKQNQFLPKASDADLKYLSENISKVFSNFIKINQEYLRTGKGGDIRKVEEALKPVIENLKSKYQQELQKPEPQDETQKFFDRTSRMEADVKLGILDFLENELKGAVKPRDLEKFIMDAMGKRHELVSTYTQKELNTGKIMLSHQNNLAIQRLAHLVIEVAKEVLHPIYEKGKQEGKLTAKVLQQIRVALFLCNNSLLKMG